jgi:hypothetical protein
MITNSTKRGAVAAAVLTALVYVTPQALAAGPYDGTWVLDFPAAGFIENADEYACPALRLPLEVQGGQVIGALHRVPSTTAGTEIEAGGGPNSVLVTGTVQPNGIVNAQWGPYHARGKLDGNGGAVTVNGECGPRVAQAVRVGAGPVYPQAAQLGN